jgi:hypothetical protein
MKHLIDDVFYVVEQKWGTWDSYDKDDKCIITSLTQDSCISATRWFLKSLQEGFTEPEKTHEGVVGGKL